MSAKYRLSVIFGQNCPRCSRTVSLRQLSFLLGFIFDEHITFCCLCCHQNSTKSYYITPVFKYLQCLKINENIRNTILPATYKMFTTNQPTVHNMISVQPCRNTRSSSSSSLMLSHQPVPLCKNHKSLFSLCIIRLNTKT